MNRKRVVLGIMAVLCLLIVFVLLAILFAKLGPAPVATDNPPRQSQNPKPATEKSEPEPASGKVAGDVNEAVTPPAAEKNPAESAGTLAENLWQDINEETLKGEQAQRQTVPTACRTVKIDKPGMQALLAKAPMEIPGAGVNSKLILILPMPDGTLSRYRIEESPIMAPELAAKFPELKTYHGQGIDDPTATLRFDLTPKGFHAMVIAAAYTVYIDPYAKGDTRNYISYFKHDLAGKRDWRCNNRGDTEAVAMRAHTPALAQRTNGATLRTFRLAISCTVEYTAYQGGTVPTAMNGVVTTMNRVNGIYEREVAVHMNLVANENTLINTVEPDGFTNGNPDLMINENQTRIDAVIGTANYDIGHVFGTNSGGLASLACVGNAAQKAMGVTGSAAPSGDSFDVDYVAHEMGHQFGADHSFNDGSSGSCGGGNRDSIAAYEPGSGSTIMCYAGICGAADLQAHSDDYFHFIGLDQIIAYLLVIPSVGTPTATGNTPPTANAGANFTIPAGTPFILTATGSDADGDAITYCWEEYDLGAASPPESDNGNRPIFRSFNPTTNPSRTFPRLADILSATPTFGELLPTTNRNMTFKLTVRDNRAGGGAIQDSSMLLSVNNTAGPFAVTAPNTAVTFAGSSQQTITWSVNNTDKAPVSTDKVNILMSTDGGNTFPTVLASGTPNDGTETLVIPNVATTQGRIKVEAVNNIYFDISDANFTVNFNPGAPTVTSVTPNVGPVTGGTSVTISGTNFDPGTTVSFGGVPATNVVISGFTSITCTVPASESSSASTVDVSVDFFGSTGLLTNGFSYQNAVPVLAGISPQSGTIGGPAFTMTLNGSNFAAGAMVKITGNADLTPATLTPTSLTVSVPASYIASGASLGVSIFNPAPGGGTSAAATFTISPPAPAIDSATTATGTVGTPFNYTITASDTPTNFTAAPLPSGLSFANGIISGTPTAPGTTPVALSATNLSGTGTAALSITINAAPVAPLISSALSATGTVGTAFGYTIAATGTTPITLTASPLPAGLTLAGALIAGTPAAAGTTSVTLTASNGTLPNDSKTLLITVNAAASGTAPVITSALAATGTAGTAFSYTITSTGTTPIAFSTTALPAGLTLSGATISGTPTAAGTTSVTLSASNGTLPNDNKTLVITINSAGSATSPVITSAPTASATKGSAFTYTITASGTGPITFGAIGLPAGLSITADTISGTPTIGGKTSIVLSATNSGGSDTKTLILTIAGGTGTPPVFTSPLATPQPVAAGQPVTLAAATSDTGSLLFFTWDFGDGTTGTGPSVMHVYSTPGVYTAVVTVSDGVNSTTQSVNVPINSDAPALGKFVISKKSVKFGFKSGKDSVSLSGTVPLPAGFDPAGKQIGISIGNFDQTFTLDSKGKSGTAFKLVGKLQKGVFTTTSVKFMLGIKNLPLFSDLEDLGFENADVAKPGESIDMPVIVTFVDASYLSVARLIYTAKKDVSGSAK